jgi:predicted Zn-dependent peptidase
MLPKAETHRLSNRCRIVTVPMANQEICSLLVGFRSGKRDEGPDQPGLAHLTEHLVFKGSRHYPSPTDVEGLVAGIGGQINATTTHEHTTYTVQAPVAGAMQGIDLLADMLLRPLLPEAELDTERQVIKAELRHVTQDFSSWSVFLMQNLMWNHQPLAWDIEASLAAVDGLTASDVQDFIQQNYVGSRAVVVIVAGSKHLKRLAQHAALRFGAMPAGQIHKWPAVRYSNHPRSKNLVYGDSTEVTMRLGWSGLPFGGREGEMLHLVDYIIGLGSASRLYQRLREKHGLVYDVRTESAFFSDAGMISTATDTDPENAHRVLQIILEEHDNLRRGRICAAELKRAKAGYIGEMSFLTNDPTGLGRYYMENVLIGGRMRQLQAHRRTVETTSLPEIERLARKVFRSEPYLVAIGPKELRLP